jgi:hypothetical protein
VLRVFRLLKINSSFTAISEISAFSARHIGAWGARLAGSGQKILAKLE